MRRDLQKICHRRRRSLLSGDRDDKGLLAAEVSRSRHVAPALARYDRQRRPRTQAMSRAATRQLRFGQQLRNPVAVAARNTGIALTPNRIALLALARYGQWHPPALDNQDIQGRPPRMVSAG